MQQSKASHFLIIDDSYIDRLVSGMMIRKTYAASTVTEMSGGSAALDWLKSQPSHSNLVIILDIMMPQMNGFQFLDHFDKLEHTLRTDITIVMLSSTLDENDRRRAREHPCVKDLLSKPLSPNELTRALSSQ